MSNSPHIRRPSTATVIATIALMVALSGTTYAVTAVPKNSVGTAQIRNGAVTSAKVKNKSLLASDFKPGQLAKVFPTVAGPAGAPGAQGAPGAAGPVGDTGAQGPPGPSYGLSVDAAVTSSVTGCITADLATSVISPTHTVRVLISGQGRLSTDGATSARLVADIRTGGGTLLGAPNSGSPFPLTAATPIQPVQYTFTGIAYLGATPVDLPPGTYNVRLRLEQTADSGSCAAIVTASGASMTVLFVGTTQ